jgi:hypothetical protein
MASGQGTLQVGNQPHHESDHAVQLLDDIAALREHRSNSLRKEKTPAWSYINAAFKSVESYIQKTCNQPSNRELLQDMQETAKAQRVIQDKVTAIKNILENSNRAVTPPLTYAKVVGDLSKNNIQARSLKTMVNREISVKLNNPLSEAKTATKELLMERVNQMLASSRNLEISRIKIVAVEQHPSGDLKLITHNAMDAQTLVQHREEWKKSLDADATVQVPTYGIIVHGVSTRVEVSNITEVRERIQWSNPELQNAVINYIGWLKRDVSEKRASSMVVEFDNPRDADYAILNGMVLGAEIFTCEYYDRNCKLKQWYRCQNYVKNPLQGHGNLRILRAGKHDSIPGVLALSGARDLHHF